jgi:hypothetical protein
MKTSDYKKAAEDLTVYADGFRMAREGGEIGRHMAIIMLTLWFTTPKDNEQELKIAISAIMLANTIAQSFTDNEF